MGHVDFTPELLALRSDGPDGNGDSDAIAVEVASSSRLTSDPPLSVRPILRPTSAFDPHQNVDDTGETRPPKRVQWDQATVFNVRPAAPRLKMSRSQHTLLYWMCGAAAWVFFMGLWLFLGSWYALRSNRHTWSVVLAGIALHLCFYGGKGVAWCLRLIHRSATTQANRARALAEWKEE